ncbi:hypothetical protein DBV15_04700 [Temnothorax longispinosus]|uniref:Uncharacterized protein n=1 Tax=Temnothorax longispinosus TaxID=300112 RepID=A0A4S2KDL4_9HYME|nr:hypothetical protein DBV15_04700 [Temnothorax longispinosus]
MGFEDTSSRDIFSSLLQCGLWSGVKLSGPHTVVLIPVVAKAGISRFIASTWVLNTSQFSSYKLKAKSSGGLTIHII